MLDVFREKLIKVLSTAGKNQILIPEERIKEGTCTLIAGFGTRLNSESLQGTKTFSNSYPFSFGATFHMAFCYFAPRFLTLRRLGRSAGLSAVFT